ncbi:MAG TPA: alkaline phosphatase family protein, partial [Acidimicrobiales bacterium]|nr:alkaline phosphatase family protein [Acidimicrobiales bacterium]
WDKTVLSLNYDEWGGFFDHVAPSKAPDLHPALALRGFRVPAFVIGPRARRHTVAHGVFDHTSILKMIEWRWGLEPLTPRDSAALNIAQVLDFSSPPDLTAPQWQVPTTVPVACNTGAAAMGPGAPTDHELTWFALAEMASKYGFRR